MADILILYTGLLAFYRTYGAKFFEDFDLTAGFFQAILEFSKLEVGESLEKIGMSNSDFHFYSRNGFAFVLNEERNSGRAEEQVGPLLEQLADAFFEEYPNAASWNGTITTFANFINSCDRIMQVRPTRRGFPVLFRVVLKPFFITPVSHVVPVSPENEESLYELQYYLKKYAEQVGRKNLARYIRKPFLLYLPRSRRIAYTLSFHLDLRRFAITHLLCYVAEEKDWFIFYQLISLIFKRAQNIVPDIAGYLKLLESNPIEEEVRLDRSRIQDLITDWADLNQYVGIMHAMLSDEFFKAGMASEDLAEAQARASFLTLLTNLEVDFDKVLVAALGIRQILFVGEKQQLVEQALSAFLAYYPHPSVTLWATEPSDALFIGTRPDLVKFYDESAVIVDLTNNQITGGEKNAFCANLLNETAAFAKEMSVSESRMFFQGKISAIFTLLKAFLEVLNLHPDQQPPQLMEYLRRFPEDTVQLITLIIRNLNPLLAKVLREARKATQP